MLVRRINNESIHFWGELFLHIVSCLGTERHIYRICLHHSLALLIVKDLLTTWMHKLQDCVYNNLKQNDRTTQKVIIKCKSHAEPPGRTQYPINRHSSRQPCQWIMSTWKLSGCVPLSLSTFICDIIFTKILIALLQKIKSRSRAARPCIL